MENGSRTAAWCSPISLLGASSCSTDKTRRQGRCADLKQMVHGVIDAVAAPCGRFWTQKHTAPGSPVEPAVKGRSRVIKNPLPAAVPVDGIGGLCPKALCRK